MDARLTGADVAASDDATGARRWAAIGNWNMRRARSRRRWPCRTRSGGVGPAAGRDSAVSLGVPGTAFIGEKVDFSVTFDNTSPAARATGLMSI